MTREDVIEAMAEATCLSLWERNGLSVKWKDLDPHSREGVRSDMSSALSSLEAMGLAIVPVAVTEDMCAAWGKFYDDRLPIRPMSDEIWAALLATSPLRKTEGGEE